MKYISLREISLDVASIVIVGLVLVNLQASTLDRVKEQMAIQENVKKVSSKDSSTKKKISEPVTEQEIGYIIVGDLNKNNTSAHINSSTNPNPINSNLLKGLKGTGLEPYINDIISSCKSAQQLYFTTAVLALESGWGSSRIMKDKNNGFGHNAVDSSPYESATTYDILSDSIADFHFLIEKYYYEYNRRDLDDIGRLYSSDKLWSSKVRSTMSKLIKADLAL